MGGLRRGAFGPIVSRWPDPKGVVQVGTYALASFVGLAFCAVASNAQAPSKAHQPSKAEQAVPRSQQAPASGPIGPSQAELDRADVDPGNWLTSNKGYLGYRYSALSQINPQNVQALKPVCSFKLGERGSFQNAPLVFDGVLYTTSALGTFATDATTCKRRWVYYHKPGPRMGQKNNKGAAIADGRLVRGTPDGHLLAIDARTGALLWDRAVVDASAGEYLTAAPLIWKDMVFIGKAGGELGIRGEMMAFKAADGTKIWGFNTIPSAGDTGSDTWKNPASIEHGGGATWTSYSLDEAAGLLLIPVGNAGPDFAEELRPGTNLFTNSLVALDATTGKLRWWHQVIGPEDRDWDASAVAAFDPNDGSHLAAIAGKDGVLHVVDRADGTLKFTASLVSRYENRTTPVPTDAWIRLCPVAAVQWNGPAYSPEANLLYMNGIDWCGRAKKGPTPKYVRGKPYLGWATPTGFADRDPIEQAFGWVNAFDLATGQLKWRYKVPSPPVAGLLATASGLVLTGDTNGELIALDAKSGALLSKTNLGFGALDGGLITYEANGRQLVAVSAGDANPTYKVKGDNAVVILGLP